MPGIFRSRPLGSWVAIGVFTLALVICWSLYFGLIEAKYIYGYGVPNIEADSETYFILAGVLDQPIQAQAGPLVAVGGNLLGPILLAKVLRYPLFVALFDSGLLLLLVHLAAQIPGVRRRYFVLLFFLDVESYVAAISLNKEILAAVGVVAFAAAIMRPERRKRYLLLAGVFSIMARWEQVAILLLYLAFESRFSPFRGRHKAALLFLLTLLTIAYPLVLKHFSVDVGSFVALAGESGTVVKLDSIQAKFGLPLVIIPKILMNLYNRWLIPTFFLSESFWGSDFSELQNTLIIHLHCLAMLVLSIAAMLKRRLGFNRPIPFLMYIYLLITCVNPFVQPRYQFPVYVLLCLQLSIAPDVYARTAGHAEAPRLKPALAAA